MINLDEIYNLICHSSYESTFWDFKLKPHEKNVDLLHDILCLANCKHDGDRYLIIGVYDPTQHRNKKGKDRIMGISKEDANRKTQAQLIDFLDNIDFAGGNRPEVLIEIIKIDNKEIDVIIIKNNPLKPYYITKPYPKRSNGKQVLDSHIYTRIQDKNTAVNKSADIFHIEKMWEERFGLDLTAIDKLKLLLKKPNEWKINEDVSFYDSRPLAYNLNYPEFNIQLKKYMWHSSPEPISAFCLDNKTYQGKLEFNYNDTTLHSEECFMLDGCRLMISEPKMKKVTLTNESYFFYYYCLDEFSGLFEYLYTNNFRKNFSTRIERDLPIIIFENKDELNEFASIAENNIEDIKNEKVNININKSDPQRYGFGFNLEFFQKAYQYYSKCLL
ncbi:MAG: ATP-binding protein [Methanobrevibacter arboriphilus]|uniref:ATP-binding protein n=1 Tax=Methanobrevibacter arboriphilus TaxID=39441 RepID=A0A843AKT7_METAZ|nr:ATP-binding protein [Methanobrevibacter arboriphilus]MBF4468138.1 ATP-binding protein [Methanobrevibacter arboriphilus]